MVFIIVRRVYLKLPLVKKEIFYPILEQASREVDKGSSWFTPVLDEMEVDQPELFGMIKTMAISVYNLHESMTEVNLMTLGACLFYKAIVNQCEVEDL